ncbi:MAG: sugar phosphate isomerase/epimerase [Planctomycetes bacterium]|nr:sugar phosphate isomerase/epimerase [Planctomycetota bacterium]
MTIGCFAIFEPFSSLSHQLRRIAELGFKHADVTDNQDGSSLGLEYGFVASASLDANPMDVRRLFRDAGLTPTSYCAHANLLDPPAPWHYSTPQILKAILQAHVMGIRHVITTEGDPKTDFGRSLSRAEKLFAIRERLHEPLRLAADLGITLLLEPHGELTDSIDGLEAILEACGSPEHLAINLDTGNSWLGGADPVAMTRHFGSRIEHVHWKDLPREMEAQRGKLHGCGFATIPLGCGVIDIPGVYRELRRAGFKGHTTLEVAGQDNVLASARYLRRLNSRGISIA